MRIHPVVKALILGVVMCLFVFDSAKADDVYGRIRGTITDPSGAVIPNVTVKVFNPATGISRAAAANAEGLYEFVNLPAPATYSVSIEQSGFKHYEVTAIHLALNQIYVLDVQLELGTPTQRVTVEAAPAQVESTSIQLGANLTGSYIVDLPLNGRNWVDLQTTLPGVVASVDFAHNFSTSGSRSQDNGFLVNGTDAQDLALNTPLVIPSPDAIAEVSMITNTINPEYGRNGGAIMNAVTKSGGNKFHGDALEFYRDPFLNARNYFQPAPAQFHQNQFGGTVGGPIWKNHTFFFFSYQGTRNRAPQVASRGIAGPTSPVFTGDQRSGVFPDLATSGGSSPFPLLGEDGTTHPAGTPYSTVFPTGTIPAADLNPVAVNMMKTYMPSANLNGDTFSWNPISTNKFNQYMTRIDHTFNSRDSIAGYWFIEQQASVDDESFYGGAYPGFAEQQTERIQNMNLTWNHTFGASMINDARIGYNRFGYNTVNPVKAVLPASLGFTGIIPQNPAGAGAPCIDMVSFESPTAGCAMGFSYNGPQPRIDQTYHVTDNFTWIHGTHTIKLGFDMRRAQVWNPFNFINNGYFQFYGVGTYSTGDGGADFLLGIPDYYQQSSGGVIDARVQEYYAYFQDQWKVRSNLTITYGMGWQDNTPQNDIYNGGVAINAFRPGVQSTVYPTAPAGLLFPGDAGISTSSYGSPLTHFGPRLGFAWSPDQARKWSIRGGFGIYYNQIEEEITLQNLQSPPFSLSDYGIGDVFGAPAFATPFTDIVTGNSIPNKYPFTPPKTGDKTVDFGFFEPMILKVFDPNFTTPRASNYNFTVQHELPAATIFQIGYVGHQGRHLSQRYELNPPGQAPGVNPVCAADPGCNFTNIGSTEPGTFRYDPTVFASVGVQATDANSNYNALQVAVTKKTTHGLDFQSSYTWSHSLDTTSSLENAGRGSSAPNPWNLHATYGDSGYDARQRFVISYGYAIPSIRHFDSFRGVPSRLVEGWRMAGTTTFQTGFPIGLFDSSYASRTCWQYTSYGCSERPNLVGSVQTLNPRTANWTNSTHGPSSRVRTTYWFNPNSFAPEARGVIGSSGENFFHGPGLDNWTLGMYKDTKISETTKVELRFEFFNIFNHTQFSTVGGDINSSTFGRATNARDPRIVQLAAKFYF